MLTIEPPPASRIAAPACFMPSQTPRWLIAVVRSQPSTVSRSTSSSVPMPALFTSTWTPPKASPACATTRAQSSSWLTSWCANSAVPPSPSIAAAVAFPSSSRTSVTRTDAPPATSRAAQAAPMPLAPPVTIATFPLRSMSDSSLDGPVVSAPPARASLAFGLLLFPCRRSGYT
jgi:hypothetical protein